MLTAQLSNKKMSKKDYSTIKEIVFETIHKTQGKVVYKKLESKVLTHFPDSAFKKTHWVWYRYQCTKGKYAKHFTANEKKNLEVKAELNADKLMRKAGLTKTYKISQVQTIPTTGKVLASIKQAVHAAIDYENATGGTRKIGITGEVGEILACHQLGLKLCIDPRSRGFDAVDKKSNRVQIKTRRSESKGLPNNAGRIGTFSKHPFDYALLVILDKNYGLIEIWKSEYKDLAPLLEKHKRRNPNLSYFKKVATRIWAANK